MVKWYKEDHSDGVRVVKWYKEDHSDGVRVVKWYKEPFRDDWFYYTSTNCAIPDDMAGQNR